VACSAGPVEDLPDGYRRFLFTVPAAALGGAPLVRAGLRAGRRVRTGQLEDRWLLPSKEFRK
jgi:hypothetical protein